MWGKTSILSIYWLIHTYTHTKLLFQWRKLGIIPKMHKCGTHTFHFVLKIFSIITFSKIYQKNIFIWRKKMKKKVPKVLLENFLSRAVPKVLQPFSPLLKAKKKTYHFPKICMFSIRYIDSICCRENIFVHGAFHWLCGKEIKKVWNKNIKKAWNKDE